MEKYSWSLDEAAEIWRNSADSIEDCIRDAKREADDERIVYIGKNIPFLPSVDAETVLEAIQEDAADFAGDAAENWDAFDYKTMKKELEELSEKLTAIVVEWLKKNGREPHFYQVECVKEHPLDGSGEEE